ncbi:MAG: ABC transporter permease subunit [Rhodospirillaceae bacterium]|nr:ABC transporter permease subunit [Rhodospirillaceae bacterium]
MADQSPTVTLDLAAKAAGHSPLQSAWRRFRRNRAATISVGVIVVMALLSILVPMLSAHTIEDVNWDYLTTPPSLENGFWFGTDVNGRDLFVRTFYAGRISLAIGVLATGVALVIGVIYGAVAGYVGGWIGNVMMRFCDVLYALPTLFFIVILVTVLGAKNILFVFMCIGAVEWLTMARMVRGQTLSVRQKEYIEAARAIGLPTRIILRRYIIPNVVGPVIVYVTLLIPVNILIESYLSFLGLGVQEPMTSWGLLIAQGASELESAPWMILFPATFLTLTLFCFNFIGDGLRDALDPKEY